MGHMSREKGARGEREFAALCRATLILTAVAQVMVWTR